jgi:hypothetical protein
MSELLERNTMSGVAKGSRDGGGGTGMRPSQADEFFCHVHELENFPCPCGSRGTAPLKRVFAIDIGNVHVRVERIHALSHCPLTILQYGMDWKQKAMLRKMEWE